MESSDCLAFKFSQTLCTLMSIKPESGTEPVCSKTEGRCKLQTKQENFSTPVTYSDYPLVFINSTFGSWHSFQKWKYDAGHLINIGLGLVLTVSSGLVSLSDKLDNNDPSQQWVLDYNGKLRKDCLTEHPIFYFSARQADIE